jgi:hypothetical protein
LGVECLGCDLFEAAFLHGVEVDRLILHAERILEPLELRYPLVQWHLATFETYAYRVASPLTLASTASGLTTLTANAARYTLSPLLGTRSWL